MKSPSTRSHLLNPESIALTDMVMNLFIFFFVSFSLLYTFSPDRTARLQVNLPEATVTQTGADSSILVVVDKEGNYFLENRQVSKSQLHRELTEQHRRQAETSLSIQADEDSPCKALVALFDACRQIGITQTSFGVREKQG